VAARKTVDGTEFINTMESAEGTQLKVGSLGALSDNAGEVAYRPKTAVFMKRRGSAGPDGRPEGPIPVKASLNEMRQSLRLGPANSAAHPRSARNNVFKIKQGLTRTTTQGSIPENQTAGQGEVVYGQGEPVKGDGDERTPLLSHTDENGTTTIKPYGGSDKSKRKGSSKNGKKK
jgi:metal transporter CNNM